MKILDKRGRVFGRINIIDLLLVLVVAILIVGGVYKLQKMTHIADKGSQAIPLQIEVESVHEGLTSEINIGDVLLNSVTGVEFGKVLSKDIKPHEELVIGKDGKVEFKAIPGLFDVVIDLDSKGKFTNEGILIGNNSIYVGSEIRLKSSLYVFDSEVININR